MFVKKYYFCVTSILGKGSSLSFYLKKFGEGKMTKLGGKGGEKETEEERISVILVSNGSTSTLGEGKGTE